MDLKKEIDKIVKGIFVDRDAYNSWGTNQATDKILLLFQEYNKQNGSLGGKSTLKKYGVGHFSKIGRMKKK